MSFRRTPFQFSDFNADDRRSDLLRRFGFQPEQGSDMFYEPSSPSWSEWPGRFHRPGFYNDPDWRNAGSMFSGTSGSAPGSPQTRLRNRGWSTSAGSDVEDGIPIKVVHEQSDEGDTHSDTSSQGSRSSGSKLRHEPRVHHIPIMVEPRDGSSSSGYGSDGESKKVSSPTEKKIHTIPIHVESGDRAAAETLAKPTTIREGEPAAAPDRSWANTFPRQKCQQTPKSPPNATAKSASGGTIPTTSQRGGEGRRQQGSRPTSPEAKARSPPRPAAEPSKAPPPPEEVIRRINLELKDLREQVYNFKGEPGDKQYRFLDEMLTRLMLKLDTIDPAGNDEIRRLRKLAINDVQRVINKLEGREVPCTDVVAMNDRELVEADEAGELEPSEENGTPVPMSPAPMTPEDRSGYASFKGSSSNYLSSCNLCTLGGESEAGKGGPEPMAVADLCDGGDGVVLDETRSIPEPADSSTSGEMVSGPAETTVTASGGERDVYSQLDPDASSMIDRERVRESGSSEDGTRTPYNENSVPQDMGEASVMDSGECSEPSAGESGFTDL